MIPERFARVCEKSAGGISCCSGECVRSVSCVTTLPVGRARWGLMVPEEDSCVSNCVT
jgi:hypothetical protein